MLCVEVSGCSKSKPLNKEKNVGIPERLSIKQKQVGCML
jgi:hypothetical protein